MYNCDMHSKVHLVHSGDAI